MEVLFRDDNVVYRIKDSTLIKEIPFLHINNLNNITHLDDAEVLYHYNDKKYGVLYPVYYEIGDRFFTVINGHYVLGFLNPNLPKDHTLVNLNNL